MTAIENRYGVTFDKAWKSASELLASDKAVRSVRIIFVSSSGHMMQATVNRPGELSYVGLVQTDAEIAAMETEADRRHDRPSIYDDSDYCS